MVRRKRRQPWYKGMTPVGAKSAWLMGPGTNRPAPGSGGGFFMARVHTNYGVF